MLPLSLSFRRMVLKYIPQLKSEDLDDYDNLIALRHQVNEDIKNYNKDARNFDTSDDRYDSKKKKTDAVDDQQDFKTKKTDEADDQQNLKLKSKIEAWQELKTKTTKKINDILSDYSKVFNAVQKLYSAKKQYAQQQGNMQQIPSSPESLGYFLKAAANYRWAQFQTLPLLWGNLTGYFIKNYWLPFAISILFVSGVSYKVITNGLPINHQPVITSISVDTVTIGILYKYPVIANDPDPGDTLAFSIPTAPGFLTIDSQTGLVQGTPDTLDIGTHPVSLRVTDQTGLFDTQSYNLNVSNKKNNF